MLTDIPSPHAASFHVADRVLSDMGFDPDDAREYARALLRSGRSSEGVMQALERQQDWRPTVTMTALPPSYNGGGGFSATVDWSKLSRTQQNRLMKECT